MRKLLPAIFIVLLLAACTNSARRTQHSALVKADSLMHTHSDSALALLQSISADSLTNDANRAYHALLLSQALDKNYIDKTDDSLINIAVAYYADKPVTTQQMLAYYYHARIKQNNKAYPEAVYSALYAEAAALQLNDHYHLGLIYRLIMECYNRIYNVEKALEYAKLSYEHFSLTEHERYTKFALLDLAKAYTANQEFRKSIEFFKPLIKVAEEEQDSTLLRSCLRYYSNALYLVDSLEICKKVLLSLHHFPKFRWESRQYAHLAICYISEHKKDSALYYGKKAEEIAKSDEDQYFCELFSYLYNYTQENYEIGLEAYRKKTNLNDSILQSANQQKVEEMHNKFLIDKKEIEKRRAFKQNHYLTFIVIFVIVLLLIIVWNSLRRKQRIISLMNTIHQTELEKIKQQNFLKEIIKNKDEQHDENYRLHTTKLLALQKEHYKRLSRLSDYYIKYKDSLDDDNTFNEIAIFFQKYASKGVLEELENDINTFQNNLMYKFREQISTLDEIDYQLAIYVLSGFPGKMIAAIMNLTPDALYQRKRRLKNNILKSAAFSEEEILLLFR